MARFASIVSHQCVNWRTKVIQVLMLSVLLKHGDILLCFTLLYGIKW